MFSAATHIRKRVGKWKASLVDRWPYWWMDRRAAIMRTQLSCQSVKLPPIAVEEGNIGEVHMLCGKKHVDMAIWSSWSFLRFLPRFRLCVHSDGTLDDETRTEWCRIVPGIDFIDKEASRIKFEQVYSTGLTLLKRWRNKHIYGAKVIDFHLFGDSDKIVLLDTDVLCFRHPSELIEASQQVVPTCAWNEDARSFYPVDLLELRRITGVDVPPRFNSGLVVMRRMQTEDFQFVESVLAALQANGVDIFHHWAEQAIIAALSTRHQKHFPLNADYGVIKGKTPPGTVARHYVGTPNIRPRFYLEGVPMLIQQMQVNGLKLGSLP